MVTMTRMARAGLLMAACWGSSLALAEAMPASQSLSTDAMQKETMHSTGMSTAMKGADGMAQAMDDGMAKNKQAGGMAGAMGDRMEADAMHPDAMANAAMDDNKGMASSMQQDGMAQKPMKKAPMQ